MTGLKAARILRCLHCPWFRNGIPPVFDSPGCRAAGYYTVDGPPVDVPGYGTVPSHSVGDPVLVLGDLFYEGPESNCPVGWWAGLTPIDLDEQAAMARMGWWAGYRVDPLGKPVHVRLLKAAIQQIGLAKVRAWVLDAIAAQEYMLWVPVEITRELGAAGIVPAAAYQAVLKDGAARILAAAWGGNDPAYYALRDCVESGACTRAEAETVATQLGIREPTGV